jgi:hypothetical protein
MIHYSNYRNIKPQVPIYGNASPIRENAYVSAGMFYPMVSTNFSSPDTLEQIRDFYADQSTCLANDAVTNRVICQRKAMPFGDYTVYIDRPILPEASTTFIVQVRWRR